MCVCHVVCVKRVSALRVKLLYSCCCCCCCVAAAAVVLTAVPAA